LANNDHHIGVCDACGKRKYLSRSAAKTVVKRLNEDHMVAYRCPREREYWHVGHLPTPVIRGVAPKSDIIKESG